MGSGSAAAGNDLFAGGLPEFLHYTGFRAALAQANYAYLLPSAGLLLIAMLIRGQPQHVRSEDHEDHG